jgi:phosphoglycerol transferase MdoB-like AlkP superfamily enzyme
MQKWLERFKQLFPIIIGFSLCFFILQLCFLFQTHSSKILLLILVSLANILSGMTLIWIICATIFSLAPLTWLRGLKLILFSILYLALFGSAICDQYFLLAHERLDEAIFLFDWNEIMMIADPKNRLNWTLFFGALIIIFLPFLSVKNLNRISPSPIRLLLLSIFSVLLGFVPTSRELDYLKENRFAYFIKQGFKSVVFSSQTHAGTLRDFEKLSRSFYGGHDTLDPRYPLTHRLIEPSLLNSYLSKTTDRNLPHIKVIIVESMSSDLFGQRSINTGNLMPFLDSLSKKSLYFPNAFATSQRTHNVLPAVLASVPNTIDGNVFQQLTFPRHFSLFNLLNKHYHTQFYCGVRLEYLNMVGLMSHYKTNYLCKKWNKEFGRHKESVGSAWGYPDEDLFKQALFDDSCKFNKLNKSKFKVFLTISSHDPFVYPNKAKWEKEVLKKVSLIKDKRSRYLIRSQAGSFGAFSYVDSTLKRFFESERKLPEYNNTVYIITGDHGTELYRRNALSKYNVPILIFSPLLKKSATSQAFVSHNDIAPTILNYLKTSYQLGVPDIIPFVGRELKVTKKFNPHRHFVFMTNKLKTTDLIANKLAHIGGRLYFVDSLLALHAMESHKKSKWISQQLKAYQSFSQYTLLQNKVIDSLSYVKWTGDQTKYVLEKNQNIANLGVENSMTYLASHKFSSHKSLKIEILASLFCSNIKAIKAAPNLVIQSRKSKYFSNKWTLNKQIKCHFSGAFKPKSINQIAYQLEFNPKDIENLQKGNLVHLYFLNETKVKIKLRDVNVKFYVSD